MESKLNNSSKQSISYDEKQQFLNSIVNMDQSIKGQEELYHDINEINYEILENLEYLQDSSLIKNNEDAPDNQVKEKKESLESEIETTFQYKSQEEMNKIFEEYFRKYRNSIMEFIKEKFSHLESHIPIYLNLLKDNCFSLDIINSLESNFIIQSLNIIDERKKIIAKESYLEDEIIKETIYNVLNRFKEFILFFSCIQSYNYQLIILYSSITHPQKLHKFFTKFNEQIEYSIAMQYRPLFFKSINKEYYGEEFVEYYKKEFIKFIEDNILKYILINKNIELKKTKDNEDTLDKYMVSFISTTLIFFDKKLKSQELLFPITEDEKILEIKYNTYEKINNLFNLFRSFYYNMGLSMSNNDQILILEKIQYYLNNLSLKETSTTIKKTELEEQLKNILDIFYKETSFDKKKIQWFVENSFKKPDNEKPINFNTINIFIITKQDIENFKKNLKDFKNYWNFINTNKNYINLLLKIIYYLNKGIKSDCDDNNKLLNNQEFIYELIYNKPYFKQKIKNSQQYSETIEKVSQIEILIESYDLSQIKKIIINKLLEKFISYKMKDSKLEILYRYRKNHNEKPIESIQEAIQYFFSYYKELEFLTKGFLFYIPVIIKDFKKYQEDFDKTPLKESPISHQDNYEVDFKKIRLEYLQKILEILIYLFKLMDNLLKDHLLKIIILT